MKQMQSLLSMQQISKSFAGVAALSQVDFDVTGGEVHALLGANGAGKSTLMKILSGAYSADAGTIAIDGEPIAAFSPRDAMRHGIQCVYQEVDTALVPQLSVAENIMLDRFASGKVWVNWGELQRGAEAVLERLKFPLPVRMKAGELSISQKQMVLIARALAQQAKFIIFDEPTAPLSVEETDRLFAMIRKLKDEGVGCIFISHRLPEVFELCDRVTVLRDGRRVATKTIGDTTMTSIVEHMLGKTFEEEFPKIDAVIGDVLMEARGLIRDTKVRGVDLTVRRGEIVGVVGLVGAGKTELSRLLAGADRPDSGDIRVKGKKLRLSEPGDAIREGIVLVPEERRRQGIFIEESVQGNIAIPSLKRLSAFGGWMLRQAERKLAGDMIGKLNIQPQLPKQQVKYLSGGNQQKVAVGKWLPTEAEVYLFDEPTKGVDIGAKSDIYRLIGKLAQEGKGIVYFSCELAEIIGISDRILVMSYGRIVKQFNRGEVTQEQIMLYASAGEA